MDPHTTMPMPTSGERTVTRDVRGEHPGGVDSGELHRLCTFELDLDCGHCVTVSLNGWYPVSVACCDRLGGAWFADTYHCTSSHVEYVRCLSQRYEYRAVGAAREATVLLHRRSRTDDPVVSTYRWQSSAGRFPARVGAPRHIPLPSSGHSADLRSTATHV